MTTLTVRRLAIDLRAPIARHWAGGGPFRSALFDALSMSFPVGEQFFIDSVRKGLAALPPGQREAFAEEVQGFVGQEATHRRVHALFNEHLARHGLVNRWEPRARRRLARLETVDVRTWVGITAATEHFTAIFADHLLSHPQVLAGTEERLQALWLWHASEESEHRSTAFDLYRALGGNEVWRRRLFRMSSGYFVSDCVRQTLNNLWHGGAFWRLSTWVEGWCFLFGGDGLVRRTWRPWRAYLRADFHPSQGQVALGARWLAEHGELAPPVAAT